MPIPHYIRLATRGDLEEIVALWKALMDLTADYNVHYRLRAGATDHQHAAFVEYLRRDDSYLLVGENEHRLVSFSNGFLTLPARTFGQATIGVLENLFVVEDHRGSGWGRATAEAAMSWLGRHGADEVHINVIPKNVGSLKFWRRMGFDVQRLSMGKRL
jgi:ribosomal protein S18 acetylase RimI-like enzyme